MLTLDISMALTIKPPSFQSDEAGQVDIKKPSPLKERGMSIPLPHEEQDICAESAFGEHLAGGDQKGNPPDLWSDPENWPTRGRWIHNGRQQKPGRGGQGQCLFNILVKYP